MGFSKRLLSGENDQIILDEIFLARKIIDKDDLIQHENRFISGDVILTGMNIPKDLLLMANQITELRLKKMLKNDLWINKSDRRNDQSISIKFGETPSA